MSRQKPRSRPHKMFQQRSFDERRRDVELALKARLEFPLCTLLTTEDPGIANKEICSVDNLAPRRESLIGKRGRSAAAGRIGCHPRRLSRANTAGMSKRLIPI